jgi:2-dehydropantoate 2-reductase
MATIFIIGAGAIGKVLSVFLQQAGKDVILLRGRAVEGAAHAETINVKVQDDTIISEHIRVSKMDNFSKLEGIVVLTNKSFGNEAIALNIKNKVHKSPVILLQNGLNIEKPFNDPAFASVYRGVLFTTSQTLSADLLRFKPVSPSPIGIIRGDTSQLQTIVEQLSNPYFDFKVEEDIIPVIWTKVIVNIVFNSICPLLETDNGIFHRDPAALKIAKRVIAECINIAKRNKVILDEEQVVNTLLKISRSSEGQLISTYQDINAKRPTEIQTLNFAVTELAAELQLSDTVTETKLLGELIKIKSDLSMIK